ncbi:hypothetical protein B0H14DRAFT_2812566 [Mycena olivaceomarginata]|nr:hypothetical protein B0H14DRAFT_2812566 [Mycena olivaceomarginata]
MQSLFTRFSKSSSVLSIDTEESDAESPRRHFLMPSFFIHNRSRSADTRDPPPPPSYYETVNGLKPTHKRSKSSSKSSNSYYNTPMRADTLENALQQLTRYDTVILVDDSGSMTTAVRKNKTRWNEAGEALATLAETAQLYDKDGIDIYFLNNKTEAHNIKVYSLPAGATPTGERLDQILKPHLLILEDAQIKPDGTPIDKNSGQIIKAINFIVITDGASTDDPKYTIIDAATRLKDLRNLSLTQVSLSLAFRYECDVIDLDRNPFVQIGNDPGATRALQELDDDLAKDKNIRDIVDTTPYSMLNPLTSNGLIKVLLGGINRRYDAQKKLNK